MTSAQRSGAERFHSVYPVQHSYDPWSHSSLAAVIFADSLVSSVVFAESPVDEVSDHVLAQPYELLLLARD